MENVRWSILRLMLGCVLIRKVGRRRTLHWLKLPSSGIIPWVKNWFEFSILSGWALPTPAPKGVHPQSSPQHAVGTTLATENGRVERKLLYRGKKANDAEVSGPLCVIRIELFRVSEHRAPGNEFSVR